MKPMSQALQDRPAAATPPASLEAQVRKLTDRVDILETMSAYCRHADQLTDFATVGLSVRSSAS